MSNIIYIDFNVSRFCIVRSERSHEPVTTDNRNYIYARFTFTSEWDGLTKTAVFSRGDELLNVEIHNNECQIPNEFMVTPGFITVSVFGGDRRTVSTATIQVVQSGFKEGLPPAPPLPSAMYVQTPDSTVPYIGYDGEFWFESDGERKRIEIEAAGIDPAIMQRISALETELSALRTSINGLQAEATAKWVLLNTVDNRSRANETRITALEQ